MIRPIFVALFTAAFAVPSVLAQHISLVSISTSGVPGNNASEDAVLSADGRYVAFMSAANTLVPGNVNPVGYDVFLRDRQAGTTTLVSVSSSGAQSNGQCGDPAISADGRFVAFRSLADNLVQNDTNHFADVFVHDMSTGATTRVSVNSAGVEGAGTCSSRCGISADGRYVVFASGSTNLVSGDTDDYPDIFVHDRQTGITTCASLDVSGTHTAGGYNPAISADGRFVCFESVKTNLVTNDLNQASDIFVHDMLTGTTERVSVSSAGTPGRGDSINAVLSADGRYVAFESSTAALVPGGIPRIPSVYVRDRQTGITSRASVDSAGAPADIHALTDIGLVYKLSISADGRFVSFISHATNLVPGDTNQFQDVFLHDNQSGATVRVNLDVNGMQGATGSGPRAAISANGRVIAFSTRDALLPGDTNNQFDVFTSENPLLDVGTPFCAGDGSGPACPCGNFGSFGHGCANSVDAQGAVLSGSGLASVAHDLLTLTATGLPDSPGLYFQSTGLLPIGMSFGDGVNCTAGIVHRLGVADATGHASQFPSFGTPISVIGNVHPGDLLFYGVWYRDASPTFCTSSRFNLTNALRIQWAP